MCFPRSIVDVATYRDPFKQGVCVRVCLSHPLGLVIFMIYKFYEIPLGPLLLR